MMVTLSDLEAAAAMHILNLLMIRVPGYLTMQPTAFEQGSCFSNLCQGLTQGIQFEYCRHMWSKLNSKRIQLNFQLSDQQMANLFFFEWSWWTLNNQGFEEACMYHHFELPCLDLNRFLGSFPGSWASHRSRSPVARTRLLLQTWGRLRRVNLGWPGPQGWRRWWCCCRVAMCDRCWITAWFNFTTHQYTPKERSYFVSFKRWRKGWACEEITCLSEDMTHETPCSMPTHDVSGALLGAECWRPSACQ